MYSARFAISVLLLAAAGAPSFAADDPLLQRLATCRDSWYEWKDDSARTAPLVNLMQAHFTATDGAGFTPKTPMSMLGFPIVQVFPQSIGMAVGFSVAVKGDAGKIRRTFEKQLGHPMSCSSSDDMKSCELKIAEKKVASLMTPGNGKSNTTLIGCYYFYEK